MERGRYGRVRKIIVTTKLNNTKGKCMSMIKDMLFESEGAADRMNELAFDLTMRILETGKKDVLKELAALKNKANEYAECVVEVMNFKSEVEREICKDCAKAGFLISVDESIKLCNEILRPDYVG